MTKNPSRPWIVCGMMLLATMLNYLRRQTISVLASRIADEMHLNDADLGRLFFAFLLAYGLGQMVVGLLLDQVGIVAACAVAVASWSLAGAASGIVTGFGFLFATRTLLGLYESPNWPLALRVVTRVFPPAQRAFASGVFQRGTSIGAHFAPPIIVFLASAHGWRASFFAVGGLGFVWVAGWLWWMRLRPEPALAAPPTTGLGFSRELAQRLVIVYLALDLGLWSGAGLVAWLARKWSVRRARLLVTTVGAGCMLAVPMVAVLRNLDLITAIISFATFGLGWFMMNCLAFSAEVSAAKVSTAVGLLGGTGSLAGAGFMRLAGGSIERSGGFGLAFLMTGVMPLIAWLGIQWATRPAVVLTS